VGKTAGHSISRESASGQAEALHSGGPVVHVRQSLSQLVPRHRCHAGTPVDTASSAALFLPIFEARLATT
jgi:hypothetical protein